MIEDGVVVIKDNRIEKVGRAGEAEIPLSAKTIDVSGKAIMSGFIDVHAHIGKFREGLSPQKQWEYFANLAYGITPAYDPSANTEMIFSQSENIKAGNRFRFSPRLFSTGIIYMERKLNLKRLLMITKMLYQLFVEPKHSAHSQLKVITSREEISASRL